MALRRGRKTVVELEGTKEIQKFLQQSREEVRKRAIVISEHQAKLALRDAVRKAPVATGALKASAYQTVETDRPQFARSEIGFRVDYAAYAEEQAMAAKAGKKTRRRFLGRAIKKRKKPTQRALSKMIKELVLEHFGPDALKR